MKAEDCPYRSSREIHDENGSFHLCYENGGDCECIPRGCPYLIAHNSGDLHLPDIEGYKQIHDKEDEK